MKYFLSTNQLPIFFSSSMRVFLVSAILMSSFLIYGIQPAKATDYAAIIDNSNWYVPDNNMLAYGAFLAKGFSEPFPLGDQTVWNNMSVTSDTDSLTTFTGTTSAQLWAPFFSSTSTTTLSGTVTADGTIVMVFTPTGGGDTTLGLGHMETVDGVAAMEMQMISGATLLTTHWAYMLPYNPESFTPTPAISIPTSTENTGYSWTAGTRWKMVSTNLFGSSAEGKFAINEYKGGYFTGIGVGPDGNPITFSQIGSITAEGKVLFATIVDGSTTLNASYGTITGTDSSATMTLGDYDSSDASLLGSYTYLNQISPYTSSVASASSPAAKGAAQSLWNTGITSLGLTGAMAPVINALDELTGLVQSNAISQTLPVLFGASSMAATQSQLTFNQIVQSRQAQLTGFSSAEEVVGNRDEWVKAFGNWSNQGNVNNVAGYSIDSGGLVLGFDKQLTAKANVGVSFAYAYSDIKSNSDVARSSINVDSYQAGLYGDYLLGSNLQLTFQLDGAINNNDSSRSLSRLSEITGVGTNANGRYNSYVGHLGVGLSKHFSFNSSTRLTPELRMDHTKVQTEAYTEKGAGLLNLNVSTQDYSTLYTSADLRVDHTLSNGPTLSANVGMAFNALDTKAELKSAFTGGGSSFVTNGLDTSAWLYNAGTGISGMLSKNIELNLRYDIDFSRSSYTNQMASAGVKILF